MGSDEVPPDLPLEEDFHGEDEALRRASYPILDDNAVLLRQRARRLVDSLGGELERAEVHCDALPGAEVEVALRNGQLTVCDHGPGIADEDLPYVFDRFYRARAARGMPGSGLGLAIVSDILRAHGGRAEFVDPPSGSGTSLRLMLPLAESLNDWLPPESPARTPPG